MKDFNDKQTSELFDKPRRGRPVTGKAKTQAQIQREYRKRQKDSGLPTLSQALAGFHIWSLPKGCRVWRKWSGHEALSWAAAQAAYRGLTLASEECGTGEKFRVDPAPLRPSS